MNKRKVGEEYERLAAKALEKRGLLILATNFRTRFGEIDIIAEDGSCICFVEVKYRTSKAYGFPEEAVDREKQRTIRKVAQAYLSTKGMNEWAECRFDVIAIVEGKMVWHKNAF